MQPSVLFSIPFPDPQDMYDRCPNSRITHVILDWQLKYEPYGMLEHDLMSIELVVLGPVISNAIIKQTHMTCTAPTNSWQQLKSQKLYLCKGIVSLNIAKWDVRT